MFLAERWGQGEGRENERQGERKGGRRRETKSLENDSKIHKNFVFLIKQLPYSLNRIVQIFQKEVPFKCLLRKVTLLIYTSVIISLNIKH